jgi:malonate transporter and related proteins
MLMTLAALLPIILIIATGYGLTRTGLISADHWHGIERLAYYILFPALLFKSVGTVDFGKLPALSMGIALLLTILSLIVFTLSLRPLLEKKWGITGPRFTSIFQGTARWNGFLALAVANNMMGLEGLALLAVAMAVMIPVLNTASIVVLSRYGQAARPSPAKILRDLATNPFNLAIIAGLAVNFLDLPIPGVLMTTLGTLAQAALPVGIICIGAGLDLSSLRRPGPALTLGSFMRPVISPALGYGFAALLGLEGQAHTAIIIACCVPTASNAYILAKLMGGDAKLMAEIITLQTLATILTMPVTLLLLA